MKNIILVLSLFFIASIGLIYSQNAKEEWVAMYNSSANDTDRFSDMILDESGNIFAVGNCKNSQQIYEVNLIKYNTNGNELWKHVVDTHNESVFYITLTKDKSDNIYLSGRSGQKGYILKFDNDGNELLRIESPIKIRCICLDEQNNIYAGGAKALIKFDSNGKQEWINNYDNIYLSQICKYKNNIYVSGIDENKREVITIKYDLKGNKGWEKLYSCASKKNEMVQDLETGPDGYIYLIVASDCEIEWWDYATIKYDSNGNEIWKQIFSGTATEGTSAQDIPEKLLIDKYANVYVTGEIGNLNTHYNFGTLKYNSLGSLEWSNTSNNDSINTGWAYDMTFDIDGNIYVTGYGYKNKLYEVITVKYNPSGSEKWLIDYRSNNSQYIYPKRILLDKNNNIFIAGTNYIENSNPDFFIIKYSQKSDVGPEIQIFSDAQKAFNEGNYTLVIDLLRDFPETSSLYDDAIALMIKAMANVQSGGSQNFSTVYGRLTNPRNINISGYIMFEDLNTGAQVGKCKIGSNGYYCIVLPSGKIYSYYIDATGFYPLSRIADFTSPAQGLNLNDNITLVSLEEMSEQQLSIRINNIFFDFNESTLKPESFLELDRLYNVLNSNPDIKVEISGHTDNVGSDEYNNKLSQSRSESVKDYLVTKGINTGRIISKGYGKSNPVETNDTEEGRQLNRRVEFKILKK